MCKEKARWRHSCLLLELPRLWAWAVAAGEYECRRSGKITCGLDASTQLTGVYRLCRECLASSRLFPAQAWKEGRVLRAYCIYCTGLRNVSYQDKLPRDPSRVWTCAPPPRLTEFATWPISWSVRLRKSQWTRRCQQSRPGQRITTFSERGKKARF